MLERYGGYTLQSKELLEKVLETKRKKYGKHLEGLTKKQNKRNLKDMVMKIIIIWNLINKLV